MPVTGTTSSGHRYSSLGDALADFCQGPYQVTFVYSDISAMPAGSAMQRPLASDSSSGTDPIVSDILTWMRDGQQRYKVLLANISHNFITDLLKPLALEQRFDGGATWTLYAAGDFTLACTNCGFLHKEEHGYRHLPNISGTHFFISAVNNTPYVVVGKPGPDGEYRQQQGVELDLLKAISGSLNFTYTLLIDPNVEYGALRNGTWTGLVGDVFYRRSHLALSEISYTLNRTDVINYMYPVLYDVLSYVTKAPKVIPFAMAIVKPFNDDVWGCVVCSLVASSLLLLSLRWSPRHKDDDNKPDFWFLLSTLSRQNPWENEHDSAAYRVFLVPWWLLVLVLTTTYSARLVAMMSVAVYDPWLSDLESLERALARRELLLCTHSATIFIEYIKASNVGALNEVRVNQLEGGREDTVLVSDRRTGFERTLYKDFAYMDSRSSYVEYNEYFFQWAPVLKT
ncbi:glutamate receptor ionotropic, delta-2-like [Haemaphysalis longicornis]